MRWLKQFSYLLLLLLSACATLSPNFEKPQVTITSFSLAPETGAVPSFDIGLRIVNPNSTALPLVGMSYSVEVEGNRILSGAKPNLPKISAYETADIFIKATPDLLGSARLIQQLLSTKSNSLSYLFKAKLDAGSLMPYINIEESGDFGINDLNK
ncbi:LEA type 2 family protein [Pseudomonadota bacterium]|nr:LEA type 2 family protein [Pseudomonadota bacterium]